MNATANTETSAAELPAHVAYFRLASVKSQLRLEKVGLKSSGGALRPRLAKEFGLKARDSHDVFIAAVVAKMNVLLAEQQAGK